MSFICHPQAGPAPATLGHTRSVPLAVQRWVQSFTLLPWCWLYCLTFSLELNPGSLPISLPTSSQVLLILMLNTYKAIGIVLYTLVIVQLKALFYCYSTWITNIYLMCTASRIICILVSELTWNHCKALCICLYLFIGPMSSPYLPPNPFNNK